MNVVVSEAVFYSVCPAVAAIKRHLRESGELQGLSWRFVKVIIQEAVSTATFECQDSRGFRTEVWISAAADLYGGWQAQHKRYRLRGKVLFIGNNLGRSPAPVERRVQNRIQRFFDILLVFESLASKQDRLDETARLDAQSTYGQRLNRLGKQEPDLRVLGPALQVPLESNLPLNLLTTAS